MSYCKYGIRSYEMSKRHAEDYLGDSIPREHYDGYFDDSGYDAEHERRHPEEAFENSFYEDGYYDDYDIQDT